jgi:hypothetical protein
MVPKLTSRVTRRRLAEFRMKRRQPTLPTLMMDLSTTKGLGAAGPLPIPAKRPVTQMMVILGGRKMAGQKPVWKTQAGVIGVALWQNDAMISGRSVKMLKATIERRYKDGEEWKSSSSFGRNDVPLVIWCLSRAFGKMLEKPESEDGNDGELVM